MISCYCCWKASLQSLRLRVWQHCLLWNAVQCCSNQKTIPRGHMTMCVVVVIKYQNEARCNVIRSQTTLNGFLFFFLSEQVSNFQYNSSPGCFNNIRSHDRCIIWFQVKNQKSLSGENNQKLMDQDRQVKQLNPHIHLLYNLSNKDCIRYKVIGALDHDTFYVFILMYKKKII